MPVKMQPHEVYGFWYEMYILVCIKYDILFPMKGLKVKRKAACIAIGILSGIFFAAFLCINREVQFQSPFLKDYVFTSVSEAVQGGNGSTYVIDQGKKTVVVLDRNRELVRKLTGGSLDADFFYAGQVCGTDDGSIYIADVVSGEQGNQIQKERVIRITGNRREILQEFDYAQRENPPLQYGEILELQAYGGYVYFLKKQEDGIDLYRILTAERGGGAELLEKIPCAFYVSDAAYDAANAVVLVTTRLGEIWCYPLESAEWMLVRESSKGHIPWKIAAVNGEVCYMDLSARGIFHFTLFETQDAQCLYQSERVLYSLGFSEDGRTVTATDYVDFIYVDFSSHTAQECQRADIGNRLQVCLFWLFLAAAALMLAALSILLGTSLVRRAADRSGFGRMALVVFSAVTVAAIASCSSISAMMENYDRQLTDSMHMFAGNLLQQIDADALRELDELSDYHSDVYMELKNRLDAMIRTGYENEVYYYYILCNTDGRSINCLLDYEDTTSCGQPLYEYGDNEYTRVLTTGERYTTSELSSYGSWMFTLLPVCDDSGNIVAELEVGLSLDRVAKEKKDLIMENALTVICSCSVVIMLILEYMFMLSFLERRKHLPREQWDITQQIPVRVMVFLVYVTDSMQDSFIAILCSKLYTDTLPVSRGVAVALPMSLQLLAAAVFSMYGGKLAEKFGIRVTMQMGLLVQMAGFLICMLSPGYMGILTGKLLIGMGMGTVYVTANTMVSMAKDPDRVESGFADVSAGVLSGVTIGAGLGSILLSFADYRAVYLAGAVLLGGGLFLTASAKNVKPKGIRKEAKNRLRTLKFLKNRRVAAFFGLILVPFMISLSYREYFFPLYVEQFGMGGVAVGRIYLGCGMLVIYIGPVLSKELLKKVGAKRSVVLASLCMACAMALFVVMPGLASVLAGMLLLSVVISFAYTCQYTYFEGLDECVETGMGTAMGIYAMFESVGQALGSVVYGAALGLGDRRGIFLLSALMLSLVCLFFRFGQKNTGD